MRVEVIWQALAYLMLIYTTRGLLGTHISSTSITPGGIRKVPHALRIL